MPDPMWSWCAMPGASRETKLNVDVNRYGDGYVHRSTRGLNPARPSWRLDFPFTSAAEFSAMDQFLREYAVPGFYFEAPDGGAVIFVTCDEWSASVTDRHGARTVAEIVGTLTATFEQAFNPQPISSALVTMTAKPPLPLSPAPIHASVPRVVGSPLIVEPGGVMAPSPTSTFPDVPVQPPANPTAEVGEAGPL